MTSSLTRPNAVARLGVWSAYVTVGSTIAFTVAAMLTEGGWLSPPWDAVLPLVPSLVLAPSFLAMLVCTNAVTPPDRRIWSQLGVAFALVYVPLCSSAYIVELFVVEPRILRGAVHEVTLLTIVRVDSVFNAIDGLGYIFMSLAALFTAPAFGRGRLSRWTRGMLIAHGAMALPVFLTYFVSRSFIYGAALWSVTLAGSAWLIAAHFRRGAHDAGMGGAGGAARLGGWAVTAIALEVFLGVGAIGGGIALMAGPQGEVLPLPVSALAGSPFVDYFVPGAILFTVLGLGPLIAARVSWRRHPVAPRLAAATGVALLIWLAVQISVIGYSNDPPLQAGYLALGVALTAVGATWLRFPSPTG